MEAGCKKFITQLVIVVLLVCYAQEAMAQELTQLSPQRQKIMPYLVQEKPVLAELITKAGLSPYLSEDRPYTLLAPDENVLSKATQNSPQQLRQLLAKHILKGEYRETDLKDGATIETLAGTEIFICRKEEHTLVNGIRIKVADQVLQNGIIHTLDGVLE